jgi:Flp pilus assembly pilin Flp
MSKFVGLAKNAIARFRSDESAQDGFEYLLVIGVVMVAVVVAVAAGGPAATTAVWTAVQNAVVAAA